MSIARRVDWVTGRTGKKPHILNSSDITVKKSCIIRKRNVLKLLKSTYKYEILHSFIRYISFHKKGTNR